MTKIKKDIFIECFEFYSSITFINSGDDYRGSAPFKNEKIDYNYEFLTFDIKHVHISDEPR